MAQNTFNPNIKYYKLCLHKGYFEKGLSITNFFKYFIALFGVTNYAYVSNVNLTIILLFGYLVGCYFLGWLWFNRGFFQAEIEVSNQFNLFVEEMRKANGKGKI